MKAGVRALGIAESFREEQSTAAGAVVRANRVVDGFAFDRWRVGGTDATETVIDLFERLDRPDVRYVLVAGIAPAWFNVLDLPTVQAAIDRPILSVTFEESDGLAEAISAEFEGEARERRLAIYRAQPPRRPVDVGEETVYVRAVGCSAADAERVVRAFTPEGGRPEPVRVARQAARAVEDLLRRGE